MSQRIRAICLSSIRVGQSIDALRVSAKAVGCSTPTFISHQLVSGVSCVACRRMESIDDYSEAVCVMLPRLHVASIQCSHVLVVQWDGFVLNPNAWSSEFLDYDYIGAPWVNDRGCATVGNGGFSIRSKRLHSAMIHLGGWNRDHEDAQICIHRRRELEELGVRFAPFGVAARFSVENPPWRNRPAYAGQFGFHSMKTIGRSW